VVAPPPIWNGWQSLGNRKRAALKSAWPATAIMPDHPALSCDKPARPRVLRFQRRQAGRFVVICKPAYFSRDLVIYRPAISGRFFDKGKPVKSDAGWSGRESRARPAPFPVGFACVETGPPVRVR
jgi:hypothetical protein